MPFAPAPQSFRAPAYHSLDTFNAGAVAGWLNVPTSAAYPGVNLAIYVPVIVRKAAVVKKLWVGSSTTATGNVDVGLYDAAGALLTSAGSTAKTTLDEQVFDVTDATIGPGIYYMAVCGSTNSDTFYAMTSAAPLDAAVGVLTEQLGAVTLQATASWAVNQTLAYYPLMGMLLETTLV